jgi:hypothetical protein
MRPLARRQPGKRPGIPRSRHSVPRTVRPGDTVSRTDHAVAVTERITNADTDPLAVSRRPDAAAYDALADTEDGSAEPA